MAPIGRRGFVSATGAVAGSAFLAPMMAAQRPTDTSIDRTVHMSGDGLNLSPHAYAALLEELSRATPVGADNYLLGGEIEAFEREWAGLLGKERAIFMPSGTLANQLALRALAGPRRRVIVQDVSHVYNDTGDACQTLSALTLLPLAQGRATFTKADVEAVLARTASGRVAADIGAISIETPVRRLSGQMFDWGEIQTLSALARDRGIGMHLDGARVFIASAYTGITPAQYAAPFDTVYVSLWKYFGSGIGAILAGPARLLDDMHHTRRMFGGNLAVGWPAALVARHVMQGFETRLKAAVDVSEDVFGALARQSAFSLDRIPQGTNLSRLTLRGGDSARFRQRLAESGIVLPSAGPTGVFTLAVNETWARRSAAEIAAAVADAAS